MLLHVEGKRPIGPHYGGVVEGVPCMCPTRGLVVVAVEPHCTDGCCAGAFAAVAVDAEHLNVV